MRETPGSACRVDAMQHGRHQVARRPTMRLHVDERRRADGARHRERPVGHGAPVGHAAPAGPVDRACAVSATSRPRSSPSNPFMTEMMVMSAATPRHTPEHRHPGNEGHEEPLPPGPDIAQADEYGQRMEHAGSWRKAARLPAATRFCTPHRAPPRSPGGRKPGTGHVLAAGRCYIVSWISSGGRDHAKDCAGCNRNGHGTWPRDGAGRSRAGARRPGPSGAGRRPLSAASPWPRSNSAIGAPTNRIGGGRPAADHTLGVPDVRRLFRIQPGASTRSPVAATRPTDPSPAPRCRRPA